jgi:hypothetical protein
LVAADGGAVGDLEVVMETVEPTEETLERICEAHWSSHGKDADGVHFSDIHTHNACNHTLSGTVDVDGVIYGFVIDSGNNAGTVVREWGPADDVGVYEPGPPVRWTLVPKNPNLKETSPALWSVYLAWQKESWFAKMISDYSYDRHFQPGCQIENHYRALADKRGLKFTVVDDAA